MENWRRKTLLKEELSDEIQSFIDKNDFLKGKLTAKQEDFVESDKFVLLFSDEASEHIKERHSNASKPGSLFNQDLDLREVAKNVISKEPSEQSSGRVKWIAVDAGEEIGSMGVAKSDPEEVEQMEDYQMPDGRKEMVKISEGEREPTNELSLITAELGELEDGRKALSLITMFPGGDQIDGEKIPMDRSEFASKGFYFVVEK
jgi:hypothetical protein